MSIDWKALEKEAAKRGVVLDPFDRAGQPASEPAEKFCNGCEQVKPLDEFYPAWGKRHLRQPCKRCIIGREKARRLKQSHPRSMEPKACSQCGDVKSARSFYSNKRMKDGLHRECKACHLAYIRKRARAAARRVR